MHWCYRSKRGVLFWPVCVLTDGPGSNSQMGHKELQIYLALVCLVKFTGKVSGEGDIQSVKACSLWENVLYNT